MEVFTLKIYAAQKYSPINLKKINLNYKRCTGERKLLHLIYKKGRFFGIKTFTWLDISFFPAFSEKSHKKIIYTATRVLIIFRHHT